MFRKKKGTEGVQGYDRISRLIEDRQRELSDDGESEDLAEDTIVMHGQTSNASAADDDSVSLLDVRGRGTPAQPQAESGGHAEGETLESGSSFAPSTGGRGNDAAAPTSQIYDGRDDRTGSRGTSPNTSEVMPVPTLAVTGGSSLVAADATWEGKLRSQGDIRVEGTFRGEVDTNGTLVVAPHARIHATVRARNVMLAGDVEGDITCEERLEILPGGSARGQINSGTLVVHEGAYIDSRFQMRREPVAPGS